MKWLRRTVETILAMMLWAGIFAYVLFLMLTFLEPLLKMERYALRQSWGATVALSIVFLWGFGIIVAPCLVLLWILLKGVIDAIRGKEPE